VISSCAENAEAAPEQRACRLTSALATLSRDSFQVNPGSLFPALYRAGRQVFLSMHEEQELVNAAMVFRNPTQRRQHARERLGLAFERRPPRGRSRA